MTWLGVTYYLEPGTTRAVLLDLAELLAPGSEVVFDYQVPLEDLPARYADTPAAIGRYLGSVGEPQLGRFRRRAVRDLVRACGFERVVLPEPAELHQRYYAPLRTSIPMSARFGFAVACR